MKLKEKTKKRIRGSISVLLVIILLPMMTFSALIVDMSRINMAKQMMSSAGDLTMNSALANYDTILKDVYGLFAMSQANNMTDDELGQELENYFARTLTAYGVVPAEDSNDYVQTLIGDFTEIVAGTAQVKTTDFLEMDLAGIDVTAQRVPDSQLSNASVLRKQIVEYMKYRAPLSFGLSFLDSLTAFEKVDDQNDVVEAQVTAQESTQDVTQACAKLIQMIREYDKRVVELDTAIKGVTKSDDNAVVHLADYDTHVNKYLADWGDNYTHINKLNLVFLVKSPSIDNAYLKSLGYGANKYFVLTGGTGLLYDSNISVSPDLGGDKDTSKGQVYTQIEKLNGQYLTNANNYEVLLPSGNLVYSFTTKSYFANGKESAAIDAFINFEKFFLNEAESGKITYNQVKETLEQITILGKYYDNFKTQIDAAIAQAEQDVATAQGKVNAETANRDTASGNMQTQVNNINWTTNDYASGYESMDDALAFLNLLTDEQQTNIRNLMQTLAVPTGDYGTYYTMNFTSPPTNRYHHYFKWLTYGSNFVVNGTTMEKDICTWTQNFLNEGTSSYYDYMVSKLGEEVLNEDLFKLLKCLNTCSYYTDIYNNNIAPYNNAVAALAEAEAELAEAEGVLASLELERETVQMDYNSCLAQFRTFSTRYQADLYYYGYYIEAAKNIIADEYEPIKTQFSGIIANLNELATKLSDISDQIKVVQEAINTYNDNLEAWKEANNTYKDANGSDSFSGQTEDDIAKAKTEYNPELYDTLDLFVISLWNEFDDLHSKLTEAANFTYGGKRIDQITGTQDIIDAAASVKSGLPSVVTVEKADEKLSSLYKAESMEYVPYTMDYTDPPQLTFLDPQVLQIQALKYLNSAYADETKLTEAQKTENAAKEQEYEDSKAQLTSGSGSSSDSSSSSANGDYGYTYDNDGKISSTENFPSHNKDSKKEVVEDDYQLKEDGEGEDAKLNASESVGAQSSKLDTVFQGIGNVATTALENLYVLNYIFENFSYNTIVQEQVIEDNPFTANQVISQMGEFATNATEDAVKAAKEKITTFSNYTINEYNNHLFGGEVEYILFGNSDPAKNVTYAKASIYGIRFVFNCIFAFTDSEIRNTTMAAGLAVQAATLGFVPYQLVQIVLQLALAAAESAIDLSAMCDGISVAIVKTKDTWSLSISNAADVLVDAAQMTVTDALTDFANTAINGIANGLNEILGAATDELNSAIYDLGDNLEVAAQGVLQGVVDSALSSIMSQIEEGLNSLLYVEGSGTAAEGVSKPVPTKDEVLAQATTLFQDVRNKLNITLTSACGGNEVALTMMEPLTEKANELINNVEGEVMGAINSLPTGADITAHLTEKMDSLKLYLIEQGNTFIGNMSTSIISAATGLVDQYSDKLQGYIYDTAGDLSEEAAQAIKDEVSAFADEFAGKLQVGTGSTGGTGGTGGTGSTGGKASLASMFKFGYKDYLMVLTYISICTGDSVLLRTADVIQMNLQNAGDNADFSHNSGSEFLMSNAYTYLSITAETELDMFFMDMDLFKNVVSEIDPTTGQPVPSTNSGSGLVYKGLLGY